MREVVFPPYLEFWHTAWPFRLLYLLSLVAGLALGLLITPLSWGKQAALAAAILAPVSAFLLHVTVLFILGRNAQPPDGFWLRASAQVGAALTLFFQFSGFLLPGLGLAALGLAAPTPIGFLAACACLAGAAYCVWITPYCVNVVFH